MSTEVGLATMIAWPSASPEKPDGEEVMPRMYPASQDAVLLRGAGQEECGQPISEREGAWICFGGDGSATDSVALADPDFDCVWSGNACWMLIDTTHANNRVDGVMGWGGRELGDVHMFAKNSLHGSQMRTIPQLRITTSTKDLRASGELLWGDLDGAGTILRGTREQRSDSGQAAGNTWFPWGNGSQASHGYKSYTTKGNHSNVIRFGWEKGGYYGWWWVYQKSIVATDWDNNNRFRFNAATNTYRYDSSVAAQWEP
jgi:hypothetical protein